MRKNVGFKVFFFIGKGGVGKTTCATAFSLQIAKKRKTLIISLDPAHNLGDVLGVKLNEEPTKITNNLYAIEVNFEHMIAEHLKNLTNRIKDMYGYLKVLNLDSYIDTLRYSPGIEEYATLDKIIEVLKWNLNRKVYEAIVFDTPPTGLTLRIMALPSISSIWLDKLMKLRIGILSRRKIIEKITGEKIKTVIGGKTFEVPSELNEDPIFNELLKMKDEVELVSSVIKNPVITTTILVVNPEVLTILEAKRAYSFLKNLNIPVKHLIINKVITAINVPESFKLKLKEQEKALSMVKEIFKDLNIIQIPFFYEEPKGIDKLQNMCFYINPLVTKV